MTTPHEGSARNKVVVGLLVGISVTVAVGMMLVCGVLMFGNTKDSPGVDSPPVPPPATTSAPAVPVPPSVEQPEPAPSTKSPEPAPSTTAPDSSDLALMVENWPEPGTPLFVEMTDAFLAGVQSTEKCDPDFFTYLYQYAQFLGVSDTDARVWALDVDTYAKEKC